MLGLYLTPLYELSLRNGVVHSWVHLHLLVVGCLFAEAVIGLDPGWGRTRAGRQLAYPVRLLLVVLLVLPGGLGGLWVRLRDLVVGRLTRSDPSRGSVGSDDVSAEVAAAERRAPDRNEPDDESLVGAG